MRHLRRWTVLTLCAATGAWATAHRASAQEEAQREIPADARKMLVERRTEEVLSGTETVRIPLPQIDADLRKDRIEVPTQALLVTPTTPAESSGRPATPDNPKVAPGLVRWHADLAAAQAASRVSGKPVLVFQMLGQLDDEFC